jgi:hypothetical protein
MPDNEKSMPDIKYIQKFNMLESVILISSTNIRFCFFSHKGK